MATQNGVRIGDSQRKLTATYGTPHGIREAAGVTTLFYRSNEYAAALSFQIHNGRIVRIGFAAELV